MARRPLPQSDDNAQLKRDSYFAIQGILKGHGDKVIFREEGAEDYGCDAFLELIDNRDVLNYRAYVQIKSTKCSHLNEDNSVSYSISVVNFSYLANSPCGMYLLYLADLDEVRYVFLLDEMKRITTQKPGWEKQKTFTLKFTEVLNSGTIDNVWKKIHQINSIQAQFREKALYDSERIINLQIDTEQLVIVDIVNENDVLIDFMRESKLSHIPGNAQRIIELFAQIPQTCLTDYHKLVAANAFFMIGNYFQVKSIYQSINVENLTDRQQSIFKFMIIEIDKTLGLIDDATAQQEVVELFKNDRPLHIIHIIQSLPTRSIYEPELIEIIKEANMLLDELKAIPNITDNALLHGEFAVLRLHGERVSIDARKMIPYQRLVERYGLPYDIEFKHLIKRIEQYRFDASALYQKACTIHQYLLAADIASNLIESLIDGLEDKYALSCVDPQVEGIDPNDVQAFFGIIDVSLGIYDKYCYHHGVRMLKWYKAILYHLLHQEQDALKICTALYDEARKNSLTQIATLAKDYLDGKSHLHLLVEQFKEFPMQRAITPEQKARGFMAEIGILENRHSNILRDVEAASYIAILNQIHCRNISLLTTNCFPSLQMYSVPSKYICTCQKHSSKSSLEDSDWNKVISAFRAAHCSDCSDAGKP